MNLLKPLTILACAVMLAAFPLQPHADGFNADIHRFSSDDLLILKDVLKIHDLRGAHERFNKAYAEYTADIIHGRDSASSEKKLIKALQEELAVEKALRDDMVTHGFPADFLRGFSRAREYLTARGNPVYEEKRDDLGLSLSPPDGR